jgi:hypothetical protein
LGVGCIPRWISDTGNPSGSFEVPAVPGLLPSLQVMPISSRLSDTGSRPMAGPLALRFGISAGWSLTAQDSRRAGSARLRACRL